MLKSRSLYVVIASLLLLIPLVSAQDSAEMTASLLTDPFLQLPTEDGVHVVWFTEFEGSNHSLTYGENLDMTVEASTMKMSRLAEDPDSWHPELDFESYTPRDVWRHEAYADGLTQGERVPYFVSSIDDDGIEIVSETFSLSPLPAQGQALKILLTSDHQLMPMTPANLQIMMETVGQVDAVFFAGDLQNVPDRASEWFDYGNGGAFFPALQGNASRTISRSYVSGNSTVEVSSTWNGAPIIQNAPLFPTIGNHEVMGRYNPSNDLGWQFNNPQPRSVAEARYELYADTINPTGDPAIREQWITDNSWNTITYEEMFTLPEGPEGERYYSIQFGDVYYISLFSTRIASGASRYQELDENLSNPDAWNYGQVLFGTIEPGNAQYDWLLNELNSEAFQNARFKIVQLHHPVHSLGGRAVPAFTEPRQVVETDDNGNVTMIRYEYPLDDNYLINYLEPMLEEANVDLVQFGHTHIWERFVSDGGINYLDSSNVGNTYGANWQENVRRTVPPTDAWNPANYPGFGDPYGLEPVFPSIAPLTDSDQEVPYISSNDISAFTILDTETGTVSSYYIDLRYPEQGATLFDQFTIGQ